MLSAVFALVWWGLIALAVGWTVNRGYRAWVRVSEWLEDRRVRRVIAEHQRKVAREDARLVYELMEIQQEAEVLHNLSGLFFDERVWGVRR